MGTFTYVSLSILLEIGEGKLTTKMGRISHGKKYRFDSELTVSYRSYSYLQSFDDASFSSRCIAVPVGAVHGKGIDDFHTFRYIFQRYHLFIFLLMTECPHDIITGVPRATLL